MSRNLSDYNDSRTTVVSRKNLYSDIDNAFAIHPIYNDILPITDIIGKHNVATLNFGEEVGYVFRWNLGFNINQYNGTKEVNDILKVFECLLQSHQSLQHLLFSPEDLLYYQNQFYDKRS
mgnify:CR=1 FL=1